MLSNFFLAHNNEPASGEPRVLEGCVFTFLGGNQAKRKHQAGPLTMAALVTKDTGTLGFPRLQWAACGHTLWKL